MAKTQSDPTTVQNQDGTFTFITPVTSINYGTDEGVNLIGYLDTAGTDTYYTITSEDTFLEFDTSSLPLNARITDVMVRIKASSANSGNTCNAQFYSYDETKGTASDATFSSSTNTFTFTSDDNWARHDISDVSLLISANETGQHIFGAGLYISYDTSSSSTVNKVEFGDVLIDLTEDTVSAEYMLPTDSSGKQITAHDKSGQIISGAMPVCDAITADDAISGVHTIAPDPPFFWFYPPRGFYNGTVGSYAAYLSELMIYANVTFTPSGQVSINFNQALSLAGENPFVLLDSNSRDIRFPLSSASYNVSRSGRSYNVIVSDTGVAIDGDTVATVTIPSQYITTTDANATANDIVSSKTAYVNGSKLTGTLATQNFYTGTSEPSSSVGSNGDLYLLLE